MPSGCKRTLEFLPLFNYHLTKMREIGVLKMITERWTTRRKPKDYSDRIFQQVAGIRVFSSKNGELFH